MSMRAVTPLIRRVVVVVGVAIVLMVIGVQSRISDTYDPAGSVFPTHAITWGHVWKLEIAHTDALRSRGLGGRDNLSQGNGMLFLFKNPDRYGFWMQGMKFPLDMIFLRQGEVIHIERGIQPGDNKVVIPPAVVDQVLELNAGEAARLERGDYIWFGRWFSSVANT